MLTGVAPGFRVVLESIRALGVIAAEILIGEPPAFRRAAVSSLMFASNSAPGLAHDQAAHLSASFLCDDTTFTKHPLLLS